MLFRILCVEENPVARFGLQALRSEHPGLIDRIVPDLESLHASLIEEHFDVVVLDSQIGVLDAFDLVAKLREKSRDLRFILFCHVENPTIVARAIAHDFYDVVMRNGSALDLIHSIQSLDQGTPPESSLLHRVRNYLGKESCQTLSSGPTLGNREVQVLSHIALGLSNQEISNALGISLNTTKEYVRNILRKLELPDRTAAAVWLLQERGGPLEQA